ncbi:hypothetical protein GGR21_001955 [Dysgonomonas hofstadii]|uniref:DUF4252 domain-containing protein n=1 Tax=Dysgonomonas hofstadii TaxID=637886 RepID=A0A840CR29_9BACT|nr:DUF4252 domain-containing protein [Dysgonomonas hofstadii]MBB4036054.1 hypothetical protein [Dysgonomonas hofstadii]
MKKFILLLVLVAGISLTTSAQDLNKIMADLAKIEGAVHQVVNKETLDTSLKGQKENLPSVVEKLTSVEVVVLENGPVELSDSLANELSNFKDGNGFATLLTVKDGTDKVRIISHKEDDSTTSVYVIVIDEEDIVFVKMTGNLTEEDIAEIVKEQQKKK